MPRQSDQQSDHRRARQTQQQLIGQPHRVSDLQEKYHPQSDEEVLTDYGEQNFNDHAGGCLSAIDPATCKQPYPNKSVAGIGLRHSSLGEFAVPLGILTCGSMLIVMWSSELSERLSARGVKAFDFKGVKRFHPDGTLFLLAPFTWLGWLVPILVASSVCTPIFAIVISARYFLLKRHISKGGR